MGEAAQQQGTPRSHAGPPPESRSIRPQPPVRGVIAVVMVLVHAAARYCSGRRVHTNSTPHAHTRADIPTPSPTCVQFSGWLHLYE